MKIMNIKKTFRLKQFVLKTNKKNQIICFKTARISRIIPQLLKMAFI